MSFTYIRRCAITAVTIMLFSGCAPANSDSYGLYNSGDGAPPQATATATLDWEQGTVHLPLEAYGMSERDRQVIYAAREVALIQCALDSSVVPPETLPVAQAWLDRTPPGQSRTLYGFWDENYLAVNYLSSNSANESIYADAGIDARKSKECASSDQTYMSLGMVAAGYPVEPEWQYLSLDTNSAYAKTISSSAFAQLRSEKEQCIREAGYALAGDDLGGVALPVVGSEKEALDSSIQEQQLAAVLVEATCSDNMGFTQKVADLNASYEQDYINAHQAQLIQIKKLADDRVAMATKMLQDAGVM